MTDVTDFNPTDGLGLSIRTDGDQFKDFTLKKRRVHFRIDADEFDASPALTIRVIKQLARVSANLTRDIAKGGDGDDDDPFAGLSVGLEQLTEFCRAILDPKSHERFEAIAQDLDLHEQVMPLLYWLLEAYGLRPTEVSSSSSSSSSSGNDGTTFEGGASVEESAASSSTLTSSST